MGSNSCPNPIKLAVGTAEGWADAFSWGRARFSSQIRPCFPTIQNRICHIIRYCRSMWLFWPYSGSRGIHHSNSFLMLDILKSVPPQLSVIYIPFRKSQRQRIQAFLKFTTWFSFQKEKSNHRLRDFYRFQTVNIKLFLYEVFPHF